jgi:ketosteroid isomerase-like protein
MNTTAELDDVSIELQVGRLTEARRTGDVEAILALCGDDIVFEVMGSGGGQPLVTRTEGKDAFRATLQGLCARWRWLDMAIANQIIGKDGAAVEMAGHTLHTISNHTFQSRTCLVLAFRDGLVVALREYVDSFTIARIAGLSM